MKMLLRQVAENRNVVLLTFEVFWIAVFVLHAMASNSGAQVTQFVYVNF